MRHVFSSRSEIAHEFAKEVGHNPEYGSCGNMSFDTHTTAVGQTYRRMLSYGHYPIAILIEPYKQQTERIVLIQSDNYSQSTSSHISAVRRATNHYKQFVVPNVSCQSATHERNIVEWLKTIEQLVERELNPRCRNSRRDTIQSVVVTIVNYITSFRLPVSKLPRLWQNLVRQWIANPSCALDTLLTSDQYATLVAKRNKLNQRAEAKRAKANREREDRLRKESEQRQAEAIQCLAGWRNHSLPANRIDGLPFTALRISADGTKVESSQHAYLTIEQAWRLWTLIIRMRERNIQTSDESQSLDLPYRFVGIDYGSQSIKVGCHTITLSELELIAPQVELLINANN